MGIIKKAIERKEKRQDTRADRKTKRQDARIERKSSRVESKNRARETNAVLKNTKAVEAAGELMDKQAEETQTTPQDVAVNVLKNPRTQKQLRGYMERKGVTPAQNQEDAAAQAAMVYTQDVRQRMEEDNEVQDNNNGIMYEGEEGTENTDEYPEEVYEDEILEEEFTGRNMATFDGTSDPDSFLSAAAVAAIAKGAPVLIDAINVKRAKDGKKPIPTIDEIVSGKGDSKYKDSAIGKAQKAAEDEYIAQKKKEEVKKAMPYIIGAVLLLIIGAVALYNSNPKG